MSSKRKKNSSNEGPVKIVGINHGVCFHLFLLDGWKKERFADVTFYCKDSSTEEGTSDNRHTKLRANRSVLVAASPFFADLLPDCELENDICISIELTFDEMFSVLEYIYSGKLLCPLELKDRILNILNDFQIYVPDEYLPHNHSIGTERDTSDIEIIIEEEMEKEEQHVTSESDKAVMPPEGIPESSEDVHIDWQISGETEEQTAIVHLPKQILQTPQSLEKQMPKTPQSLPKQVTQASQNPPKQVYQTPQKLPEKSPGTLRIYGNRNRLAASAKAQTVHQEATNGQNLIDLPSAKIVISSESKKEESRRIGASNHLVPQLQISVQEMESRQETLITDDLMVHGEPDREAVTLQLPTQAPNATTLTLNELENSLIKHSGNHGHTQPYPLPLYHSHTWCYGIYSPMEPEDHSVIDYRHDDALKSRGQPFVHDWTSFRQPTFLVCRPKRVYKPRKGLTEPQQQQPKQAVLKLTDISNMKAYKGKIHVTLNGQPIMQPTLPPLFHDSSEQQQTPLPQTPNANRLNRRSAATSAAENDNDKIDLALAKHFLQEEVKAKQKLQMRIKMFSERLAQYKDIARAILRKQKEMEDKKRELEAAKLVPGNKKSGPQTQCEQCGKMVLASRLNIHLKIHSGVKSHLCDLCGRAFLLKAYLNAHIRINHRDSDRPKRFMCSSCGYTCDQKHKLEVHERVHTDERPFDCQYCDKKFREKGTLVRHIRTHTGEKPYACNICGTAYAARDTYVQHYRRKHQPRPDGTIDNRPRYVSSTGERHSNMVLYTCEFCQKSFYRVLAYEKHRASHTGVAAAVRCNQPDCDFTYSDMTQLKDHMVICHPGKTYSCNICSKVFLTKQNLANHQSKHDPTLGFHCSYCSLSLTTKASLIAHEKIHTREKPYECSYCGMRFHSPYLIKIHLRKHQPSQPKRKRSKRSEDVVEVTVPVGDADASSMPYY